jgi:hypothetical protein
MVGPTMRSLLLGLATSLVLSACGGGHNPDKDKLSSATQVGNSSYYDLGQGKGLISSALSAVSSGANFEVSFRLQDGGSFTLITFADSNLNQGLNIQFTRTGNSLRVTASANSVFQEWSALFANIDAAQDLTFTVDIHNNEKPSHILLWQGSKNSHLDHTNTVYNSAEDSVDLDYDASPGNGRGRQWGFILNNSEILNAQQTDVVDAH